MRTASSVDGESWHTTGLPVFDCDKAIVPSGRTIVTGSAHWSP
jgi:hypothetical protein